MKFINNVKNTTGYKKINFIIIAISIVMIFSMSVGYSILQERLNINSNLTIRAVKDIRITNISNPTLLNGAYETYNAKYNVNTITNNIVLPNLNSTVSYDVTITNNGTVPMKVKTIEASVYNNENIKYTLSNVKVGSVIAKQSELVFTITYSYNSSLTSVPDINTLGSVIDFTFEEYTENPTRHYIEQGLVLNLEGVNPPVNNKWLDNENNKEATLNSVTHDALTGSYDFSNNGYASLGEIVLPKNNNFTLEVLVTPPATFNNTEDQSIVSQVNDSTNDSGRFKLDYRVTAGNPTLEVWLNETSTNTPGSYVFGPAASNVVYLMQVVRTNSTLDLYFNGNLVSSNAFSSDNNISQTNMKLGKWNSKSLQQYKGKIHAVRVYDHALSSEEINNNYLVDQNLYVNKDRNLKEYVIETSLVNSGNGLYADGTDAYRYRGTAVNNYLKFSGDNDIYRIINFESDGTMKLLNTSRDYNIAFDSSGNRDPLTSKYCTHSETHPSGETVDFYGCNYFNTTNSVIGGSDDNVSEYASIKNYINTTFYNSLPSNVKEKIITHNFACGRIGTGISPATMIEQMNQDYFNGKVGLLTAKDLYYSLSTTPTTIVENATGKSYLISLTTTSTLIWTMNGSRSNTWDVMTVSRGTGVSKRRASRTTQPNGLDTLYYYAYPAFYIKSDYDFTGSGSLSDPFVIG